MNCTDLSELIDAYLDRELDLVRRLNVEEHLKNCPACSQLCQEQQALHSALTSNHLYFEAPARLRKRIDSAVREASRGEAPQPVWSKAWLRFWVPAGALALLVLLALVFGWPSGEKNRVSAQIVATQLQSVRTDHLTEVASADQKVLKSWFYSKLGFGAPAVDLAAYGFPLLGGRVDTIDNHPAAVVVYHYQKQAVSLFVWPLQGAESRPEKTIRYQGYNLMHWTQSGLSCWAVSDIDQTHLQNFVRLVKDLGYASETKSNGEGIGLYEYQW